MRLWLIILVIWMCLCLSNTGASDLVPPATHSTANASLLAIGTVSDHTAPADVPLSMTFTSPGRFLLKRVVAPLAQAFELSLRQTPVSLPPRPRFVHSIGPLRQITLVNRDQITGELSSWQDGVAVLQVLGRQQLNIPIDSLAVIAIPQGEIEIVDLPEASERPSSENSREDFPSELSRFVIPTNDQPHLIRLARPVEFCRIQFWARLFESSRGGVTFSFEGPQESSTISIKVNGVRISAEANGGHIRQVASQSLSSQPGWHQVTMLIERGRILALIDEKFLGSFVREPGLANEATQIEGQLHSIEFVAEKELFFSRLLASHLENPATPSAIGDVSEVDGIRLKSGDELFAGVTGITRKGIEAFCASGSLSLPWSQIVSVKRPRSPQQVKGVRTSPTNGLMARIQFQSIVDRPLAEPDFIEGTIFGHDSQVVFMEHPLLGKVAIPWKHIRKLEPRHHAEDYLLDARATHLGDSIRPDFYMPIPEATIWSGELMLQQTEVGRYWLSLNVADLEPSGSETPPGSQLLKELREGQLVTEVTVNDQFIGELNRLARFKASPMRPERLRINLPAKSLRPGSNKITIRQRSAANTIGEFDDIEISNIRVVHVTSSTNP